MTAVATPATAGAAPAPSGALAGRVVMVTGAAGGLGRATSIAAARQGATLVLLGRKIRPLEQLYDAIVGEGGAQPAIYPLDLEGATAQDYEDLADAIGRQCGRLDAIVHAAARFDGLTPLAHVAPDAFLRALHANLSAPWLLTRACLPMLAARADAAIVFVLDDAAEVARPYRGAYGIAKSALPALVAMLHAETDRTTVRVHGVLPTPMATRLRARAYFAEDSGRLPSPDHCAHAIVGIVADKAHALRGGVLSVVDASRSAGA